MIVLLKSSKFWEIFLFKQKNVNKVFVDFIFDEGLDCILEEQRVFEFDECVQFMAALTIVDCLLFGLRIATPGQ